MMKHWLKVLALAAIFISSLAQATTPTIAERATSKVTSNSTSHAVTLPVTGIASGDLLIAAISWDCTAGTATLTGWPAGWTLIDEQKHSTGSYATSIYYKIATGSETSPMTLTTSSSDQSVHRVWRISAGTFNPAIAPGFASNLLQSNLAPDPPSLTPAGGSKTYLWLALASVNEGNSTGTATVTGFPASYTDTGTDLSSVSNGAVALGWAEFASTAASENPGAFALFGAVAENNDSYTVFVAPSGPATFLAGPTLGTPTATTLPTTFTTDQTGDVKAVACPDGQTAPTQTQVFAGNCTGDIAAAASFTEAVVVSVADAHTFTGLVHSTVYDLYFGIDAAIDSAAVSTIANATTSCGGTPSVTSVSSDDILTATETNFSVVGTSFCLAQGSGSLVFQNATPTAKTITCSSWANTLLSGCNVSGVGMGVVNGLAYGALTAKVANSTAASGTRAITVNPPTGTTATSLSSVVLLEFDEDNNPSRLFADPLDLQSTSVVAVRNIITSSAAWSGATTYVIGDAVLEGGVNYRCILGHTNHQPPNATYWVVIVPITVNADATLAADSVLVSFDWDFSRSDLYLGTVGSIAFAGCPPHFGSLDLPDLVFQEDQPIIPLELSIFFVPCDEIINFYSIRLLGAPVDSTTDINGAVVDDDIWVVDDASVLLDNIGDYVQAGSGPPVLLRWANPLTNEIRVGAAQNVDDNAQINIRTTTSESIPGLTLDNATGNLSGTPTTSALTGPLVFRAKAPSGIYAESP